MFKNKQALTVIIIATVCLSTIFILLNSIRSNKEVAWIKMFYWDHQANYYLVKEIPVESLDPQEVLDEIIKDKDFIGRKIIPYANIVVENHLAIVDIPSVKINGYPFPGDKIVADSLESLTYTLCVNPELGIHEVQYLLDGSITQFIGPSCTDSPMSLFPHWIDIYIR